ncbi:hypothetical protein PORY_000031 [Pneumocystis oryctolagi]|uniref:Uncharacterized protein n=1 Tax=Pneumocystis oryctolagi TaxID=42067 RepID=A0ACB7CEM3_9ASCO|nr:hypothetical protein PORY_000031 [Pneumocystis oryctolagi]
MIFTESILLYIIEWRESYKKSRRFQKKSFWGIFFKNSFCEVIWKICKIYKTIYRILSRKTSICRILDRYSSLDEHTLLKNFEERQKSFDSEENEKLGNLVWNIYIELCMSVTIYSEWQDLLYRAGYLDSFEETNFIDAVMTSILLKKKVKYDYKSHVLSKQCLSLRYSITCIFCIEKEKKHIMQKCLTQVEYDQNREMFQEIWDAVIVSERIIQNNKKNWVMIGFQGDDPSTDFRSMGIFGLELLHHFVLTWNEHTRIMISESRSNQNNINLPWYSFALAAINILAYIIELMNQNRLEKIFIQRYNCGITVNDVIKQMFCCTFISFHNFWKLQVSKKNVRTVFDFECCLKRFKKKTKKNIELGNIVTGLECFT